ncbi:MAG: hypothetical protein AB7K04_12740 [Pseudorhodoplanes sp.]
MNALAVAPIALLAMTSSALAAQTAEPIEGRWSGFVSEPQGSIPRYRVNLTIGIDREGRPLASVRYDAFPCSGVWTDALQVRGRWRFRETILDNPRGLCASHGDIELELTGEGLNFRWALPAEAVTASGQLTRD